MICCQSLAKDGQPTLRFEHTHTDFQDENFTAYDTYCNNRTNNIFKDKNIACKLDQYYSYSGPRPILVHRVISGNCNNNKIKHLFRRRKTRISHLELSYGLLRRMLDLDSRLHFYKVQLFFTEASRP